MSARSAVGWAKRRKDPGRSGPPATACTRPRWRWASAGRSGGALRRRYRGPVPDSVNRVFSLTFDDGPDPVWTPRVLDVLARHGASATFFVLGPAAERHPEPLERARAEGHEVALHADEHVRHTDLDGAQLADDTRRALTAGRAGRAAAPLARAVGSHDRGHPRDRRPHGPGAGALDGGHARLARGPGRRHAGRVRARRARRQRGADARRARPGRAPGRTAPRPWS